VNKLKSTKNEWKSEFGKANLESDGRERRSVIFGSDRKLNPIAIISTEIIMKNLEIKS
jgi:hypothetical protein